MVGRTPEEKVRLVSVRDALRLGLWLIALGLALIFGPLLLSLLPSGKLTDQFFAGYTVFLLVGVLFLALGASIVFSLAVKVDGVAAGQFKPFGLDLPMEIQGALFVFVMLLLAMGFTANYFDLTSLADRWSGMEELQKDAESHKNALAKETKRADENAKANSELRSVIVAQLSGGMAHRIVIQFACDDLDEPQAIVWVNRAGTWRGILPTKPFGIAEDTADREKFQPVPLTKEEPPTFVIVRPNPADSTKVQRIVSAKFQFVEDVLVATIWPNEISLSEVCSQQGGVITRGESGGLNEKETMRSLDTAAEAGANQ